MSLQIEAAHGASAETVLLPGDPLRAEWAARRFLDNPVVVNRRRRMLGFTGSFQGQKITILGTGMGMASLAIYATELVQSYGARRLIRVGTAGALQPGLAIHDLVLVQAAATFGGPSASRALLGALQIRLVLILGSWLRPGTLQKSVVCPPRSRQSFLLMQFMTCQPILRQRVVSTACSPPIWKRPSFTCLPRGTKWQRFQF